MLSCAVLLLLLVAVLSRGRRCSIAKILRQYRAVIFHEIQNLVSQGRDLPGGPALALGMLLGWMQPCSGMWGEMSLEALIWSWLLCQQCWGGGCFQMEDPCSKQEALILRGAGSSCFISAEEPDWVCVQEREGWARLSFGQGEHGGTQGWGVVWAEPPGSHRASPAAGALCFSPLQDQKILLSIYNISMSLREVGAGTLQGPEELAVWRVARNTEIVLRENCRKISKVGSPLLPSHPSGSQVPGLWADLAFFCALLCAREESPGSSCSIPGAGGC